MGEPAKINTFSTRKPIFKGELDKNKAIILCYIAFLFTGFQCAIYGMLTVPIAKHFNLSSSHVIFCDGFGLWGQIAAMASGGLIIRHIKAKNTLIIAAFLMIIGSVFSIISPSIYLYAMMSFLCNMAVGYVLLACNYMVMGTVTQEGKSQGKLSILNVFFSLGFLISASIVGMILHYSIWQMVFISIMILFIVFVCILLLLNIDEILEVHTKQKNAQRSYLPEKKPGVDFLNARSILVAIALFFIVYVEQIMNYFNQPYLHYNLGFDIQLVGILVSSYTASQLLGRVVFGHFLLPKVKTHQYLITSSICFAIFFCLYLISNHSIVFVLIIMIALGLCDSCIYPSIMGFGIDQLPSLSSCATSFFITTGAIGIPIGTSVSGFLGEHYGAYTAMLLAPILLSLLALLIGTIDYIKHKKTWSVNLKLQAAKHATK